MDFFRRRECLLPTMTGWLTLAAFAILVLFLLAGWIHPFLAMNEPAVSEILVVEGWLPDFGLEQVASWDSSEYRLILTTGEEFLRGSFLVEFESFAGLARATLLRLGVDSTRVVAVPSFRAQSDRTYASAVSLKRWLHASSENVAALNVVTLGAHARRSRAVFQSVLGDDVKVGVIAIDDPSFDEDAWWQTSQGFDVVLGESVGLVYWWLFGGE